jgi:biotin carboxyl carrier protein
MKKYRVKVNEKMYEVELEEIESNDSSITQVTSKPSTTEGGQKIKSLMQGVIIDVKVSIGQKVVKGQTLAILETMKMENEIVSPLEGTISKIFVSKQDTVENQEVIMIIN